MSVENSAEAILSTAERGDVVEPGEAPTIVLGGQTYFIRSFVGDRAKGALLVSATRQKGVPANFITDFLLAAVNVAVISTDWSKTTPDKITALLTGLVTSQLEDVHRQHMLTLSSRPKPS